MGSGWQASWNSPVEPSKPPKPMCFSPRLILLKEACVAIDTRSYLCPFVSNLVLPKYPFRVDPFRPHRGVPTISLTEQLRRADPVEGISWRGTNRQVFTPRQGDDDSPGYTRRGARFRYCRSELISSGLSPADRQDMTRRSISLASVGPSHCCFCDRRAARFVAPPTRTGFFRGLSTCLTTEPVVLSCYPYVGRKKILVQVESLRWI